MKKIFLLSVFFLTALFASAIVYAQDSTNTGGGGGSFIPENIMMWLTVAYGVFEIVIRVIPTAKNYSIISFVMKLLQWLVPNKSSTGKKFD